MRQFSIVIPLLGDSRQFEDTLASVLRHRPAASEVLVIHAGNYRDPYGLGDEVDFVTADGAPTPITFWRAAVEQSQGAWLMWMQPGAELSEAWDRRVMPHLQQSHVGCIAPRIVGPKGTVCDGVRVLADGSRELWRSESARGGRHAIIGATSAAGLYRREALKWLPEIDDEFPAAYWDADVAVGLTRLGYCCSVAADWQVSVTAAIEPDFCQPCGEGAERLQQRHSNLLDDRRHFWNACQGLLRGQGWRWTQWRQRSEARASRGLDRRYNQLLKQACQRREALHASRSVDSAGEKRRVA